MRVSRRGLFGGVAAVGVGAFAGSEPARAESLDRPFAPVSAPHLIVAEQMVQYQRLLAAGHLPEGLAGHWPLCGDGVDRTGRGALVRGAGTSFTTLRAGGELSFDTTPAANATAAAVLDTSKPFTVSAWVRLAAGAALTTMYTAVSQDSGATSRFLLQWDPEFGWAFKVRDPAGTVKESAAGGNGGDPRGVWVHLAGVSAGGTIRLFVDGVPGAEVASSITPWAATTSLHLGRATWNSAPANRWNGAISDVRVYQRALSADEVRVVSGVKARANNVYDMDNPAVLTFGSPGDPASWIARARCASFISGVLGRTYPWVTAAFFDQFFGESPEAEDYQRVFAAGSCTRFRRVERVTDLQPGDLIAIDYDPARTGPGQVNSGHIVMVRELKGENPNGPAIEGAKQYAVEVVDCTADPHGVYGKATYAPYPDTRMVDDVSNFQGAGIGHMMFYADAAGLFAGYRWSANSGSDGTYPIAKRPVAAARVV
ncbi:LamG domain-containing protein [Actinoplanes sp. NPDC048988]|uniref:LamG domain-containing protein n=1 Tax=Actinoplanes sp. NPDC048988 TaxID=3363901 RepID=UPI0037128BC8